MTDTDTETIRVADVSAGPGGDDTDPGTEVTLPAVEILTGRGFVTGKSGSGKSNTASVVVEKLLSKNFPILIVDTDGEYYGLKEEFELLHVGADDECDIQVNPEHAEKIASLALEQNVPIILDVSGYLDEAERNDLLLKTTRQLFAKEKKLKKPFLMLVEEVHEYIPEGGGMDETGKMLIKVGKRGRKHGLGIVGISQRPADVKKDFITQCDWLVWHRLTWRNDTKVVKRILGSEYSNAIEDLDAGEGFLVTDWAEEVRRVQFHRKTTFDAGATPGLDDFERPDLKSVSGDLVDELRDISDEKERRESELADLRQELDRKEQRIRELEAELEDAQDLRRFADQLSHAMLQKAEASYNGGSGRNLNRPDERQRALREYEEGAADHLDPSANESAEADATSAGGASDANAPDGSEKQPGSGRDERREEPDTDPLVAAFEDDEDGSPPIGSGATVPSERNGRAEGQSLATAASAAGATAVPEKAETAGGGEPEVDDIDLEEPAATVAAALRERVAEFDGVTRRMLAHYRTQGIADPVTAQVAAGGPGDHKVAYSRNRTLRKAGFVRHAGRGKYAYALPDYVRTEYTHRLNPADFDATVRAVEAVFADDIDDVNADDVDDGTAGGTRVDADGQ